MCFLMSASVSSSLRVTVIFAISDRKYKSRTANIKFEPGHRMGYSPLGREIHIGFNICFVSNI